MNRVSCHPGGVFERASFFKSAHRAYIPRRAHHRDAFAKTKQNKKLPDVFRYALNEGRPTGAQHAKAFVEVGEAIEANLMNLQTSTTTRKVALPVYPVSGIPTTQCGGLP